MTDLNDIDLNALLAGMKPSVITPNLADIAGEKNDKKIRLISHFIMKDMVDRYNGDGKPKVPKVILHDEEAIEVRYVNVEPLLTGIWPIMSLMLLHLSYGEQTTLIEALYPKTTQFAAKAFAAVFTPDSAKVVGGSDTLEVKSDPEIKEKLDSANAGIAMILAALHSRQGSTPHPDEIHKHLNDMSDLVAAAEDEGKFKQATKRAQDSYRYGDR